MKIIVIFLFSFTMTSIAYSQNAADEVLSKVSKKLNSLKQLRYTNTRELNYASEDYHNVTAFNAYYDFESSDTLIGCKYQIEDSLFNAFFNGTEKFDLYKQQKTIQINERPSPKSSFGYSGLYNSLLTLRNILPVIIHDTTAYKSIADTTVENIDCHLITINIHKRRIWNSGKGFDAMKTQSDFIYKLIVDKSSLLPMIVWQVNNKNSDFIKTQFTNIDTNPTKPTKDSWNYSTYLNEYKQPVKKDYPRLAVGSPAPGWKLPVSGGDKMLSLDDLKGKVVLVDFWIKACGPCIEAIPHLKELQQKFKDKPFEIVSINVSDAKDVVDSYTKFHKTTYTTLFNGREVAEQYGVKGFPKFYLLDKEGKVVYVQEGFDDPTRSTVEKLLKDIL